MIKSIIVSCRAGILFPSLLVVFLLFPATVSAQTDQAVSSQNLRATPEVLALLKQCEQSIEKATLPMERAMMQFQVLALELRLADKEPAKRTIQAILQTATTLEKANDRFHLYETVAHALVELGRFDQAIALLEKIDQPAPRAESQLNLAERILFDYRENKTETLHDVSGLLTSAADGARETKDAGLESLSLAVLGREWARQGDLDRAKATFQNARKKAREIEDAQERGIVALIVRGQVQCGMIPEALATIQTVASDEQKQAIMAMAVVAIAQEAKSLKIGPGDKEKIDAVWDDLVKFLVLLKPGNIKDKILFDAAGETASWIPPEKLNDLADMTSGPEQKEMFLQNLFSVLVELERLDDARQLAQHSSEASDLELMIQIAQLESLIGKERFDEAERLIASFEDEQFRQVAMRHLILARIKGGNLEEVAARTESTLSDEEKEIAARLDKESDGVAEIQNADDRTDAYFDLLKSQLQLFDIKGARKTIDAIKRSIDQSQDQAKQAVHRLFLARILTELADKQRAADTLRDLMLPLEKIENLQALSNLVPEEQRGAPEGQGHLRGDAVPQPVLNLNLNVPVDEDLIKNRLVELYLAVADAQTMLENRDEAHKTLARAVDMAGSISDPVERFERLLQMTLAVAELSSEK